MVVQARHAVHITRLTRRALDVYVKVPPIARTDCPLSWWAKSQTTYPTVGVRGSSADSECGLFTVMVVQEPDHLPDSGSSRSTSAGHSSDIRKGPTERLFSKAADVVNKQRNRLVPSKADRIIFLMDNL